jgi:hypothetical protein
MGRMVKDDDLFLVRLNTDELHAVCLSAQTEEMVAIKFNRPKYARIAGSIKRKAVESIGRKFWPATAYAEVPVHG